MHAHRSSLKELGSRLIAGAPGALSSRRTIVPLAVALLLLTVGDGGRVEAQAPPPYEVAEKSLTDLQKALTAGQVTSRQLVQAYFDRITAYDHAGPALNSMSYLNAKALEQADALDRERRDGKVRGPLHGIPVVVKDNYDTADMPTQNGSLSQQGVIPPDDAYLVKRLRDGGAIILGKTNMHEFARGITSIGSLFGAVRNPYNPTRNPGGSSGGTGAAVAASLAAIGMGSDTCGSIRLPAAHNNLVGMRVTLGLSSRDGIIPLALTQDVGGPLGRTVEDVAIVLDATVGPDSADAATANAAGKFPKTYLDSLKADGLKGARIGYLTELFGNDPADLEVAEVANKAVTQMVAAGAQVRSVHIPGLQMLIGGSGVINEEFKFQLEDYLKNTPNSRYKTLRQIIDSGQFHESLRVGLERSQALTALDTAEYRQRMSLRSAFKIVTLKVMADAGVDYLVYPSIRRKAELVGAAQPGSNCQLSAQTGMPALTVPGGFTRDGMPVGIELLGKEYDEAGLLKLGYSFEQATKYRRAPASTPALR